MWDVHRHPIVRNFFPALGDAALVMGSQQIRNRATVIGNICNASPAAETAASLLVYEATVSLLGAKGVREVSLADFFKGPGRTIKTSDELVTAIKLPIPESELMSCYKRLSRREGVDLAVVNVAMSRDRNGGIKIAYGSLAPVPFRAREVEAAVTQYLSKKITEAEFSSVIERSVSPIDDLRSSRSYKIEMVKMLTIRGVNAFAGEGF
jgi:carbon-monoxide dehydrogenase medium subunit